MSASSAQDLIYETQCNAHCRQRRHVLWPSLLTRVQAQFTVNWDIHVGNSGPSFSTCCGGPDQQYLEHTTPGTATANQ